MNCCRYECASPQLPRERLHGAERRWVALENLGNEIRLRLPLERLLPRDHLVEHAAEREDVGARFCVAALHLLRRHVLERAEDCALVVIASGGAVAISVRN